MSVSEVYSLTENKLFGFRVGVMPGCRRQENDVKSTPDISVWMVDKTTDLSTMLIVFAPIDSMSMYEDPTRVRKLECFGTVPNTARKCKRQSSDKIN